jgi:hypothetical protein
MSPSGSSKNNELQDDGLAMNSTHPLLYQINTRVWLTELSRTLGRAATLDDVPDRELDRLAQMGFEWVWFLSVWQTGQAGQLVSRTNHEWRREFQETLPDPMKTISPDRVSRSRPMRYTSG